jgi:predicted small secreted protein
MKMGRFLLGVAAGIAVGYLLNKSVKKEYIKPEEVVQKLKRRYREKMEIIGSWIQVEPFSEEINGIQYHIYQGGLTGVIDGLPTFLEFRVDADTGSILSVSATDRVQV